MGIQIQFFTGIQENFNKLVENEKLVVGSLYFIKDTRRTYKAITKNTFDPIDEQIVLVNKLPESGMFGKIYILRKLYPELYIWNGTNFIKMSIPSNILTADDVDESEDLSDDSKPIPGKTPIKKIISRVNNVETRVDTLEADKNVEGSVDNKINNFAEWKSI